LIRFQADADLDNYIVVGVRRREPAVEFLTAAEGGLVGLDDREVLEITAQQDRILITHDRRTMPRHFRAHLENGRTSPGVFIVSQFEPIGPVVEVLMMVWADSDPAEWQNQIRHLPTLSVHLFSR